MRLGAHFITGLCLLGGSLAACSEDAGDDPMEDQVIDGLDAPVEIVIDRLGVPHMYAQTDEDLMYAAGYQMATDRLFQIDLTRRRATGRLAEVLGMERFEQDKLMRIFDLRRWGAANIERLAEDDPQLHGLLTAWVAGVNTRIEQVRGGEVPLPYGFGPAELNYLPEPYTLDDHAAVTKMLFLGQTNSIEQTLLGTIVQRNLPDAWAAIELTRPAFPVAIMPPSERLVRDEGPGALTGAGPEAPAGGPQRAVPPPIDATLPELAAAYRKLHTVMRGIPGGGSNNWAVDGRHTASGYPIIAGDPHQPLESPSLMYTQHLNSADAGGEFDAIGWSFAGAAGIHLGHNADLHWTATNNFGDVMDIWEVPVSGNAITVGGQSADVTVRPETIAIAGASPVTVEYRDVEGWGVLLPDDLLPIPVAGAGNALLMNWTGFAATAEEMSFMAMARSHTLEEYEAAVDRMEVGGFNFVAADATGITYRCQMNVPDRGAPSARQMPYVVVDGTDPGALWSGFLPPEKLPRSRAATEGWVATANNDPWGFTFDGDVHNDPWYYGGFYAAGFRAQGISAELERLSGRGGITVEEMQALQSDTTSIASELALPVLAEAWAAVGTNEELAPFRDRPEIETLATLLTVDWDRKMDRTSAGALAFRVWLLLLSDEILADELTILYGEVIRAQPAFVIKIPLLAITGQYPNGDAIMQAGRDVHILRALERTAAFLQARFGGVDPSLYTWGDMHGTKFDNPFGARLDGGWVPTDGSDDTVNVSSSTFLAEGDDAAIAERFDSHAGAIFRVVTTFDDTGRPIATANFPRGNSGDPDSPHFSDTLTDWVEGTYQPLPFTREEVDTAAESVITLDPADHPGSQ
jgi:penicillin amidase